MSFDAEDIDVLMNELSEFEKQLRELRTENASLTTLAASLREELEKERQEGSRICMDWNNTVERIEAERDRFREAIKDAKDSLERAYHYLENNLHQQQDIHLAWDRAKAALASGSGTNANENSPSATTERENLDPDVPIDSEDR